jgi:photosystem II stability/assembly factor-like uncharacterized protein
MDHVSDLGVPPAGTSGPPAAVGASGPPRARLVGSFVAFLLCAVLGALPALATLAFLRPRMFSPDRLAFFVLAVFAVVHVAALAGLVPRLQKRGFASVRYTSLLAVLIWLLAVAGTMIGVRIWRSHAAAGAAANAAAEAAAVDQALGAGGFRRIVLDRYVALHDIALVGGRYYVVGGTQEIWLLRSDDGGATWASRELDKKYSTPRALAFATPDQGYLLATAVSGPVVLHTVDGGASWTESPTPSVGWAVACLAPERCWLGGIDATGRLQIHATADGGRSWIGELALDAPAAPAHFSEPLCTALPGPGERVLCLSSRLSNAGSAGGFALLRTTAGELPTWTEIPIAAPVDRWEEIWIGADRTVLAAGGTWTGDAAKPVYGGVLARSVDATGSFAVEPLGLPPGLAPMDIDIVSADAKVVYTLAGDALYLSEDGGKTFVADGSIAEYGKHGNLFLRKLEFSSREHGVMMKANGALVVRDGMGAGTGAALVPAPAPR